MAGIIGVFSYGLHLVPHMKPVEEGDILSETFGLKRDDELSSPGRRDFFQYSPGLSGDRSALLRQEDSALTCKNDGATTYRAGHQKGGIRNSTDPDVAIFAINRVRRYRKVYGHPPYAKWEELTYTATSPYVQEVTENVPLPKTTRDWGAQIYELRR